MKELNKKGEQFLKRWEKRRENKWFNVFLHGSVYKGLILAIITFFLINNSGFEGIRLPEFFIYAIIWMITGFFVELWQFEVVDTIYLDLIDDYDNALNARP